MKIDVSDRRSFKIATDISVEYLDANILREKKLFDEALASIPKTLAESILTIKSASAIRLALASKIVLKRFYAANFNGDSSEIFDQIVKHQSNKPYILNSDIHFNISHSKDLVVIAWGHMPLGIDIERNRECNYKVASKVFSPCEQNMVIEDPTLFTKIWTLKESYIKAASKEIQPKPLEFCVCEHLGRKTKCNCEHGIADNFCYIDVQQRDGYCTSLCCRLN